MQADQTVLSLRPGGGSRGGSRFLGSRFDSSSAAFTDLQLLRPHGGGASSLPSFKTGESRFHGLNRIRYTRDQFLQLREVAIIPEDILKAKQEVDAEFFGEDPSWAHGESNLQNQGQSRYSQPDSRDWHNRSAQFFAPAEERSWERQQDTNQQYKQEQLSSQFGKAQISSNQGDAEAIVRSIQDLFTSWEQSDEWGKLREQMRTAWDKL
ncbi:unnamed protein product [Fraxinus pennsylvanica]|uniref:Uncharacterized protein n=1 Tax=Fraxinus pennsylvanica TaxID=56036 RepID=A0AAD2A1R3_9LAMI|nr:unnamed protein product [Fraxinus pennsylvanica]